MRVERQGPGQLTPKDANAGVRGGVGRRGGGAGCFSAAVFVWGLSTALPAWQPFHDSHSMTAKDVPLTAPMKDCRAREEAAGGSHVPALG